VSLSSAEYQTKNDPSVSIISFINLIKWRTN